MERVAVRVICAVATAALLMCAGCTERASTQPSVKPAPAEPMSDQVATNPHADLDPKKAASGNADEGVPAVPEGAKTAPGERVDEPAGSNNVEDVDAAIEQLLGDHVAYQDVFARLQHLVGTADKAGAAALINYPIEVSMDGKKQRIKNPDEFVAAWDKIITPEISRVITSQRYQDLFVNSEWLMLGKGQVWINGVCSNTACSKTKIGVTVIQSGVL